ncbi:Uncharacterised protein [Cedecea neteri]|uniref:Uncharacterized protein n=1 Tax=Cedecea neteri TaxID=158822 RepID=A0A2X2TDW6_9ENTR|nr:Uncharacterised protein [Cedecea neteri]
MGCMPAARAHAALLKQMIIHARKVVALMDGSKLGRLGVARVGGLGGSGLADYRAL